MEFKQAFLRLKFQEEWNGPNAAHLLRGAIASAFPANDLFHQHNVKGKEIYRYPRIQYRWDQKDGIVVAFGDGTEALPELFVKSMPLTLNGHTLHIAESLFEFRKAHIKIADSLIDYYFRSPYLPLNQDNYIRYLSMNVVEKKQELRRLSTGNILSTAKQLGIRFNQRVYTDFRVRKSLPCTYKHNQLQGFLGTLVTNVDMPEDFAIGRAVSHGYGWIKRK